MAQPMFDKKIEPVAQRYIRAKLMAEEAKEYEDECKEALMKLIPEGSHYVTKDGESIAHVKSSVRKKWLGEELVGLCKKLNPRIWRAIRIESVDTKKLEAFIAAGEVDIVKLRDGFEEVPVRSSLRVTWPSLKGSKVA